MSTTRTTVPAVPEALLDLSRFGAAVGVPLEPWQAASFALEQRITTIVKPRQTGASRGLSLLAVHRALLQPRHTVLVISAGEEASRRLLGQVRQVIAHPLLKGLVVKEDGGLVTFANGSEVRAIPASEKQARGWTVGTLILDEAAFIGDDLIFSAAMPTTAAVPDARIVLASTPWGQGGAFWSLATGEQAGVTQFRWALKDAHWITPEFVALARATMAPDRFAAEFEGLFTDGGSGLFARGDLLNAVAAYEMIPPDEIDGGSAVLGCDWGRARDMHAVAGLSVVDDGAVNGHGVMFLSLLDTSRRKYSDQVEQIIRWSVRNPASVKRAQLYGPSMGRKIDPGVAAGLNVLRVVTETNGVGAASSEALMDRLPGKVAALVTTQETKERSFSRLQAWVQDGRLVLPEDQALLRELLALTAETTRNGGLRITGEGGHAGDRAMALSMAALAVPLSPSEGRCRRGEHEATNWITTPNGLVIPRRPRPRLDAFRDLSLVVYGGSPY